MNTDFEALSVTHRGGGVCELLLTRPELLNRFDDLLQHELASALESLGQDETVRSIVLASSGKVFSAGGDFALMQAAHDHEQCGRRQSMRDSTCCGRSCIFRSLSLPRSRAPQLVSAQR